MLIHIQVDAHSNLGNLMKTQGLIQEVSSYKVQSFNFIPSAFLYLVDSWDSYAIGYASKVYALFSYHAKTRIRILIMVKVNHQ